jgi:hypothetical protein
MAYTLTVNNRKYSATLTEDEYDPGRFYFIVGGGKNNKGCVVVTYEASRDDAVAVLQWFGYDSKCASDVAIMERDRSKPMLIGALMALKGILASDAPGVTTLELTDDSHFQCNGTMTSTMVASLFLHKKTYYERLLGPALTCDRNVRARIDAALDLMRSPADDFDWFYNGVKKRAARRDCAWLRTNKDTLRHIFDRDNVSWRHFVTRAHKKLGCDFFVACCGGLTAMFKLEHAMESTWRIEFADLTDTVTASMEAATVGGASDIGRIKAIALKRRRAMATRRMRS